MFGRQIGSSLLRLPIYARLPLRPSSSQCKQALVAQYLIASSRRSYATPGRPRKTVGEPSRPVKRAVKRAAKTPTSNDAATKKTAERKKAGTAKKPKAKAATSKKAKPKPAKKQLTDEQKAAKETKLAKAKLADLKKAALNPPNASKKSAWTVFVKEKAKGVRQDPGSDGSTWPKTFGSRMVSITAEYKNLSPAELEHYNHLAVQETEAAHAEYKTWVESHTPEEIQIANRARNLLKRRDPGMKKRSSKWSHIKDERVPKRPISSYLQFSISRQASGDFSHIAVKDRSKLIGQEWNALSESEKKKYKDLQSKDTGRYQTEYSDTYGHMPPYLNGQQQAAAAAAA